MRTRHPELAPSTVVNQMIIVAYEDRYAHIRCRSNKDDRNYTFFPTRMQALAYSIVLKYVP